MPPLITGSLYASRGRPSRRACKLIERVDFIPLEDLGKLGLEVQAKHKALLVSERAFEDPTRRGERLGAGTGFEPVTFRL